MLTFLKKTLERLLKLLATQVLKRYQPFVIAITGSVGKTSTKEAIAKVLEESGLTWRSELNYNNEIGVPLTILGLKPSSSPLVWFLNLIKAKWLAFGFKTKHYPEKLILELGADKPGDIGYLTSFIKPDIAVVTKVSPVHAEFFGDLEFTAKEKGKLVEAVKEEGTAVLNFDDKRVKQMGEKSDRRVVYYGLNSGADFFASDVTTGIEGTSFKLHYQNQTELVELPHLVGEHFVSAVLAAIAIGLDLKIDFNQIKTKLRELRPAPHRLNLVQGIKGSLIIDDTYNASAASVIEGLKVLGKIKGNFRIAVLGDMLELGDYTEEEHRRVGRKVPALAHLLITVGKYARFIAEEAAKNGLGKDKIFETQDKDEALKVLKEHLQENDVVLIKGSHALGLTEIVNQVKK